MTNNNLNNSGLPIGGVINKGNAIESTTSDISTTSSNILSASQKLDYAKYILSEEQYDTITEEWIIPEGMTVEKLDVLGNNDLAIEQIIAIGGEFLSNPKMTVQKIQVIGYMLGVDDIEKITPEKLAKISIEELNELV